MASSIGMGSIKELVKVINELIILFLNFLVILSYENLSCFSPLFSSKDVIVSEARVSPDFSVAKVFVATLGGGREQELLDFLAKVKGQLRKILGSKIKLRVTPDLTFIADKSFGEAAHIEELLYRPEVKRDLQS